MPIYDYECERCGYIEEYFANIHEVISYRFCPKCHLPAGMHRIISVGNSAYLGNQDAPWLKSCAEIMGDSPVEEEFKRHPTRDNLRRFMREKNLRHLERGEPKRQYVGDISSVKHKMIKRHRERMRIEI
jgi:putative FmdB family regulatory protein